MIKEEHFDGSGVKWNTVVDYPGSLISDQPIDKSTKPLISTNKEKTKYEGTPMSLSEIQKYIDQGCHIIAQVKNVKIKDGKIKESRHYVLIGEKEGNTYRIYDPGYKNRKTLDNSIYNNTIYRIIVYYPKSK